MATQSRAQRYIELRERYEADYLSLCRQRLFPSECAQRQALGRRKTLEALVADLEPVVTGMKPAQVSELVGGLLDVLVEDKATWMVNSIKKRRDYGLNELAEWTAQGAIAQIDLVIPELVEGLAAHHRPTPQLHGRFFQVFGQLVPGALVDALQCSERWNGPCRGNWYQDVAIWRFAQPDVPPEQVVRGMSRSREERPTVLWSREKTSNATPSVGDIVVSLLSGAAWVVMDNGVQAVAVPSQTEPSTVTQG